MMCSAWSSVCIVVSGVTCVVLNGDVTRVICVASARGVTGAQNRAGDAGDGNRAKSPQKRIRFPQERLRVTISAAGHSHQWRIIFPREEESSRAVQSP